jgi:hypothetical protein
MPIWSFDQLLMWNSTVYNGENVTFNYGMVQNLEGTDNVSYPVLVTIAASPIITQNRTVQCDFTVGPSSTNFSFDIVVSTLMVIILKILFDRFYFIFNFSACTGQENFLGQFNIH